MGVTMRAAALVQCGPQDRERLASLLDPSVPEYGPITANDCDQRAHRAGLRLAVPIVSRPVADLGDPGFQLVDNSGDVGGHSIGE